MTYDKNGDCYEIEAPEDFNGWTVAGCFRHKPGVILYYLKRDISGGRSESIKAFCKDEIMLERAQQLRMQALKAKKELMP